MLVLLVLCSFLPVAANAELSAHFLDVGQGLAVIIQCDGETMIYDGGTAGKSSLIYSYLTKTLGFERIDVMIASHPHADHIGGLSGALNACSVGIIYSPVSTDDSRFDTKAFHALVKYATIQGLDFVIPSVGDTFTVGNATTVFLSPSKEYGNINDLSLVIRLQYGDVAFLFTGDAEWDAEHDMVGSGCDLSADVLCAGHHGSDTSSSYVFLREVMPKYVVISVGKNNSYGHPGEDALSRLRDVGAEVYRTDTQGTIVCWTNGSEIGISTEFPQ